MRRSANLQVILGETTNDVVLALNNSRKPFSDVRVRRAITHAIDKERSSRAMFGLGRILGSNVDPLNPFFVDMTKAVPHDLAPGAAGGRATPTASKPSCGSRRSTRTRSGRVRC